MKFILLALTAVSASSLNQLSHAHGIHKDDLMQNQASHWRKVWPQGAIDNADGDAEVLNMFAHPEKKEKKPVITYPWTLDEDVVSTQESIKTGEEITKKKLTKEGVKNGGMDMIFTYDNTKRVFERNTPQGNTWYDASKLSNE